MYAGIVYSVDECVADDTTCISSDESGGQMVPYNICMFHTSDK